MEDVKLMSIPGVVYLTCVLHSMFLVKLTPSNTGQWSFYTSPIEQLSTEIQNVRNLKQKMYISDVYVHHIQEFTRQSVCVIM
jgi:hypothetical protein